MLEKQNAVEHKTAAGDAAELDDIIDAGTKKLTRHDASTREDRPVPSRRLHIDRR